MEPKKNTPWLEKIEQYYADEIAHDRYSRNVYYTIRFDSLMRNFVSISKEGVEFQGKQYTDTIDHLVPFINFLNEKGIDSRRIKLFDVARGATVRPEDLQDQPSPSVQSTITPTSGTEPFKPYHVVQKTNGAFVEKLQRHNSKIELD